MAGKRRKKNSNVRRDHRLFSDCHIFTWEGLLGSDGQQYTTAQKWLAMGGWCPMGQDLARHLIDRPRNWSVAVRALCRNLSGQEWMESRVFDLPSRRLNDIEGAYLTLRDDVLSAQRTDQVYDLGWIAQSWAGEKPEDDIELWHYYYAPPGVIARVTSDERIIRRMAGPGYSHDRWRTWQRVNYELKQARENES